MKHFLKKSYSGMTLLELSATIVVVSIIALGMSSGAQAVMLHYQTDAVRQDLRHYGNTIMREVTRELKLAQRVEIDGLNGFSRIKLYKNYTDATPDLYISCNRRYGIEFNSEIPLDGVLKFPNEGIYRGNGEREVYVKDFVVDYETDSRTSLDIFKRSFVHITLTLTMESDVMDETNGNEEDHEFHRSVFLGTPFIQKKLTNSTSQDEEDA